VNVSSRSLKIRQLGECCSLLELQTQRL